MGDDGATGSSLFGDYSAESIEEMPEAQQRLLAHFDDLRSRMLDEVETLLQTLDPEIGQRVYEIAFKPNDAVPKRDERPKIEIVHLAEQCYLAHGDDDADRRRVLQFALVAHEYYDLLDDVVDDDVAPGRETEVVLVTQLLMPTLLRVLADLGEDVQRYWSDRAIELVGAPLLEEDRDPSGDVYLDVLARQSDLFGSMTGAAAMAGGADTDGVSRAREIGSTYYKCEQMLLDVAQFPDDEDRWNARAFFTENEIARLLDGWRAEVSPQIDELPEPRARLVRPLFFRSSD
ncbi:hypothetical protein BRC83_02940 [Halobacteriales archaeon QS_1_68_17]|nr:MAG: hypothetical protein BRC83_02940 [Halobacteriales archaeon QS_1_68_17]